MPLKHRIKNSNAMKYWFPCFYA